MQAASTVDRRHAWQLFASIAPDTPQLVAAAKAELRGKNLACWCKAGAPCHADVRSTLPTPPCGRSGEARFRSLAR
nr:DUF4326 domain-containing protein [Mesorhizobium wenxiniae]